MRPSLTSRQLLTKEVRLFDEGARRWEGQIRKGGAGAGEKTVLGLGWRFWAADAHNGAIGSTAGAPLWAQPPVTSQRPPSWWEKL